MKKKILIFFIFIITILSSCNSYREDFQLNINTDFCTIAKNDNIKFNISGNFSKYDDINGLQLSLLVLSENNYSHFNIKETSMLIDDNSTNSFSYYVLTKGYEEKVIMNINDYFILNIPTPGNYTLIIVSELSKKKEKYFSKINTFNDFTFNITVTE